jgi:hypothetical protein
MSESPQPPDRPPDEPERTREMRLPPVPGPADEPLAARPTDQLRTPPEQADPTNPAGEWQPLLPQQRRWTPYALAALVLLVVAVGVVAVLVWG